MAVSNALLADRANGLDAASTNLLTVTLVWGCVVTRSSHHRSKNLDADTTNGPTGKGEMRTGWWFLVNNFP